jgi:hypothetical protein
MTRSGDLLGACTPKGTATYPANNVWTAAYPANHVGLAPSLPGSSLPGSSVPGTEPTRQTAYGGSPNTHPRPRTYPANHDACVAFAPGWAHPVDLPGKSRRVRTRWTYPANHQAYPASAH